MNMSSNSDSTIKYYDDHGKEFFDSTYMLDMSQVYKPFLEKLPQKASILDAGCGSGRDSLHFMKLGYNVTAFDASEKMVSLASELLQMKVLNLDFESLDFKNEFDGIWACAAFLHVPKSRIVNVISRMERALVRNGIMYTSFKHGDGEQVRDGRLFNYYDEDSFTSFLRDFPDLRIVKLWKTTDVRKDRQTEYWLNALIEKSQ